MRTARQSTLLATVLGALAVGCCVDDAASGVAYAVQAEMPAGDILAASPHPAAVAVVRALRVPGPCAAASRPLARAHAADPTGAAIRVAPVDHRHTPLYTLLRVYRL